MSVTNTAPAPAAVDYLKTGGIVAAVAALIAVLLLPPAAGLPPAGKIMLAILAFNVDKRSRFAGLLVITTSQTASIWNVGIKTAAPQNMVGYGTGTFAARDFVRTGLVMTAVGMVLLVVFALTYWSWMGYLVKAARARRAVPRANTGARSAKVVH